MAKQIKLSQNMFAIVDDEDFEKLNLYKWHIIFRDGRPYAERTERYGPRAENKKNHIKMHRILFNNPKGILIDHINGNTLDNRRSNLRLATNKQNSANTVGHPTQRKYSKYKGVKKHSGAFGWSARITVDGKALYLGSFGTEKAAALAYNSAAAKYFGEFAKLNEVENA